MINGFFSTGSAGSAATDAIWDAAGDLAVGTGADTAAKLTKGANGSVLGVSAAGAVAYIPNVVSETAGVLTNLSTGTPVLGLSSVPWARFVVDSVDPAIGVDPTILCNYLISDRQITANGGSPIFQVDPLGSGNKRFLQSPHLHVSSLSGFATDYPPATWPGLRVFDAGSGDQGGLPYVSDGTGYISQAPGLLGLKTDSVIKLICPNASITWIASNNGSGKVRITASGVHGLTTTPAVGAHLSVTTTQNGWVSGDFHEIATIVSTTAIDLTTNWASQGVPIFARVGTNVTLYSLAVPILLANSYLEIDCCFTSSGLLTTNKNLTIQLGAYTLYNPAFNTAQVLVHPALIVMQNANSVSAQRGETITNNIIAGSAQGGAVPTGGTVDTSEATTLTFGAAPTVNEWVGLHRARVLLKR